MKPLEKRLAELRKRQQYGRDQLRYSEQRYSVRQPQGNLNQKSVQNTDNSKSKQPYKQQLRCYVCNSPNHLARDCKAQKTESEGKSNLPRKNRVICGNNHPGVEPEKNQFQKIVEILFPSNSTTSPTMGQGTCQGEEGSP